MSVQIKKQYLPFVNGEALDIEFVEDFNRKPNRSFAFHEQDVDESRYNNKHVVQDSYSLKILVHNITRIRNE